MPREYNFDSMENFKDTYTEDQIRESLILDEALFTKNGILALCPECGHMIQPKHSSVVQRMCGLSAGI